MFDKSKRLTAIALTALLLAAAGPAVIDSSNLPILTIMAKTAHDEIISTTGVVTAGTNILTDANAAFDQTLVGKVIILDGLGAAGVDLQATVASVQDATHLTFSGTAATNTAPYWGIGRAYVISSSAVTASYAIGDTLTAVGGTGSAGSFQVVTLGAASPVLVGGGTGGANGVCTFMGTTGVTRTNWPGNGLGQQTIAGNGYFEASGTVSGGVLAGPFTILIPGDYITAPYAHAGSASPAPTMTFTNGSAVIAATAHGMVAGTPVQLSTTGGLPTNFVAATTYYVSSTGLTANAFELTTNVPTVVYSPTTSSVTTTTNGTPILAGSAGSGTQTATVVEPITPVSGCAGLVNAAVQPYMAPHYVAQTVAGNYTALPANPVATTSSGSGAGATLTLWGQAIEGIAVTQGDKIGGLYAIGTDDTTAINAAVASVMTAGGGEVLFPRGRSLMLGAWQIPYTGTTPPVQSSLKLSGAGQMAPQSVQGYYISMYSQGVTGSIIDNRFAGDAGTHVAKLDTRGMGTIQTDRISFTDFGTDNFLMFQTTNTQPFLEHTTFVGNPTCFLMTCQQNIIRFGGITAATTTLSGVLSTGGFQNNAPTVKDTYFGHVQEALQSGGAANSGYIANIQVDRTSGSWTTAPIHLYGVTFSSSGNTFYGGEIEMQGYPYGVYMDTIGSGHNVGNSFNGGPVFFDGSGLTAANAGVPTVAGFYFGGSTSRYNGVFNLIVENDMKQNFMVGPEVSFNTILTPSQGAPSTFALPVLASGGIGVATNGATDAGVRLGDGTGNRIMTINGGLTNSSDGGKLQFLAGGSATAALGNKSSVLGGAYSADFVVDALNGTGHLQAFNTDLMTWDFATGVNVLVGTRFTANVTSTPTTGGTVIIAAKQRSAIVTPAGTLATLTLQLPTCGSTTDGYESLFKSTQTITALTVTAASGSVVAPPTAATPGTTYTFHCQGSNATWY